MSSIFQTFQDERIFFSPMKQFLSSFTGFSRYVIAMNILFPITYVAEEQEGY